jgi:glyoxylase-like metal-dependent hydrolase (beta-lactamase superfamily II)
LITNDEHRVVVDTGLSIQEDELVRALARRHLAPADVDIVINTHLHVDHCGNNSVFPRASIFASKAEWEWTHAFYAALFNTRTPEKAVPEFYPEIDEHAVTTRTLRNVVRMARLFWHPERLGVEGRRRWLEAAELPAGLHVLPTPGHTPHHLSIRVEAPEPVIVAGDAVLAEDAAAIEQSLSGGGKLRARKRDHRFYFRGGVFGQHGIPSHDDRLRRFDAY